MSSPRIIIVAEHASKNYGGEAIIPYHYFRVLRARGYDGYLIVHERTRTELEALFPRDRNRLRFIPDQLLQKIFHRLGRALPRRIDENTLGLANQLLTQRAQRKVVRSLVNEHCIIHQPISVSPRIPSLLWGLGAPVVSGPLNGGMDYPPALRKKESALSRATIAFGRTLSNAVNTIFPGKRRAAVVLVANDRTHQALPSGITGRIMHLSENGVDLTQWTAPQPTTTNTDPRFLFIGRLVDWKALDVAIEALTRVPNATLDVIGDGACFAQWQKLSIQLGLADRIHFHGWVPQAECARYLAQARALVLPSLYECGGAVVLEAMAMSKPVIATAWGGPADYLDSTCGVLIPPTSREALIEGFASAMHCLATSPDFAARLGAAGRTRVVQQYDWEKKVDAMLAIYAAALPAVAVIV